VAELGFPQEKFWRQCEESETWDMDVFKLAFETIIVGLLTFLWLGATIHLLYPGFLPSVFPALQKQNPTLVGVGVLSLAYCLGSAVLPISNQLVNDEHWPLNQDGIRCQVFLKQDEQFVKLFPTGVPEHYVPLGDLTVCRCSYWGYLVESTKNKGKITSEDRIRISWDKITTFAKLWIGGVKLTRSEAEIRQDEENERKKKQILSLFQLQESKILGRGTDKTERLRLLNERIVVLRGAVFSSFALLLTSFFGYVARAVGQPINWIRTVPGAILAAGFAAFAVLNGYQDVTNLDIFDIPVLEGLLFLIAACGGFLVFKGVEPIPFLKKRLLIEIGFFFFLSYGGWIWSEVLYDQQVISSFAVLDAGGKSDKP